MENYSQYDLSEYDPYLIPGSTCLANHLGILDTEELSRAEHEITSLAMAELSVAAPDQAFDACHLKKIHSELFADIYPFAGEFRRVEIAKGGSLFLPHRLIEKEIHRCMNYPPLKRVSACSGGFAGHRDRLAVRQ